MRRKAAQQAAVAESPAGSTTPSEPPPARSRASQTWAMLIKRVYEIDPLACPCGGQMKVVAFIEPPQGNVIEKILEHCGLWQPATPRPPPADAVVPDRDDTGDPRAVSPEEAGELTFDMALRLVRAILPRPHLGLQEAEELTEYHLDRNARAGQSHRKK